jgi:hypothetical protein
MEYKKTQFGWVIVIAAFAAFCCFLIVSLMKGSYRNDSNNMVIIPLIILSSIAITFHSLTIEITETYLRFYFGFGLISKTILIEDINEAKPITNSMLTGWGIRLGWNYTLYNVSGFQSVELDIKGKKRKIRVGTSEPEEVSRIINKNIKKLTTSDI